MQITIELTEEQVQWLQYGLSIILSEYGLAFIPEPELQDVLETLNIQLQEVEPCNS
jgi:hypothetical protein